MSDQPIVEPRGTTPGGLPYPEDTDLVMAGAQAIKALAQAMDARPRLRAKKSMVTYNIPGNGNDTEQGSGGASWELFETSFNNAGDTVGLVAPLAGYYLFSASAALLLPAGQSNTSFGVKVTNTTQPTIEALHFQQLFSTGSGGARVVGQIHGMLKCAVGDVVRMSAHQNSGATQTLGGPTQDWATRFSAVYWGP